MYPRSVAPSHSNAPAGDFGKEIDGFFFLSNLVFVLAGLGNDGASAAAGRFNDDLGSPLASSGVDEAGTATSAGCC